MEVRIAFDTEKDSIEDLKKLVAGIQELIDRKEKELYKEKPQQTAQQTPIREGKTVGGCRIVPYDKKIEETMSQIFSGKSRLA